MAADLPCLILVHGYPLDGRMWRAQVEALSDVRNVIAPDLAGHGTAPDLPPATTVDDMARQLAKHLDDAGAETADVGGLSMGGYVCFAFFRLFPQRVRSLALIDTRAGADADAARQARDETATKIREAGAPVAADAMLPKMLTSAAPDELRAEVERMMLDQPPEALIADLAAMRDRPDSTPTLAEISVPTVVIVGEEDEVTPPSESEAMTDAIADARLVRVHGAAHLSPMERPAEVSQALRAHLGG